jgi:hypothetical protein
VVEKDGFGRLITTWWFSVFTAQLAHAVGKGARRALKPTGTALNSVLQVTLAICIIGLEVGGGWVGVQLGHLAWDGLL